MSPPLRLIPGTDLDAATARRAILIGNSIFTTAFHIKSPHLIAIIHDLITRRDCLGWTFNSTLHAFVAKLLKTKVNGLIWF
ncbi:hypothetical protein ES703_104749 [subsurface metagenome]